jgi:alpha-L-fucosidase
MDFIEKFGAWMAVNSEAIYSTRPWKVAGEGPTQSTGNRPYGALPQFVAGDMRFTTKGDSLYAIALAWPGERKLVIKSLASDSPHYRGEVARIGLLGSESNLVWSRSAEGVTVNLPEKPPCDHAYVFKVNPLPA